MYTKFGLLKFFFGLLLIVFTFYNLISSPSLNMYFYLSALFTFLYIIEKLTFYTKMNLVQFTKNIVITSLVQMVLVAFIFILSLLIRFGLIFTLELNLVNLDSLTHLILTSSFILIAIIFKASSQYYPNIKGIDNFGGLSPEPKQKDKKLVDDTHLYMSDDPDFKLCITGPTIEIFWYGRHFSKYDYIQQAMTKPDWLEGKKPLKFRRNLKDSTLDEFELKHQIKLPSLVRELFKIYNGGSLPTYWVPKFKSAKVNMDDWTSAFANDYNDIRPLEDWKTLLQQFEEYEDLEAYSESDIKLIKTYDKIFVLTNRYEDHTLLDFRDSSENPKVLIADIEFPAIKARVQFDSFDDFFKSLRAEYIRDDSRLNTKNKPDQTNLILNQFWAWTADSKSKVATARDWESIEAKYSVLIPTYLKDLYSFSDGGPLSLGSFEINNKKCKVPNDYLFETKNIISLYDLADQLHFEDEKEHWSVLYPNSKKMLVIAAHFDCALILDYSKKLNENENDTTTENLVNPKVLLIESLDYLAPITEVNGIEIPANKNSLEFKSIEAFFKQNFQFNNSWEKPMIGDQSISPLIPTVDNFWLNYQGLSISSLDLTTQLKKEIQSVEKKFKFKFPNLLEEAFELQNGGMPVFNYIPPTIINPHGYLNLKPEYKNWVELFQIGLRPLENITTVEKLLENIEILPKSSEEHIQYDQVIVLEFDSKSSRGVGLDYREFRYSPNAGISSSKENPDLIIFRIDEEKRFIKDSYLSQLSLLRKKI